MPNDRLVHALELFTRFVGVGVAASGLFLSFSVPILGVPLVAVGLLFALRPAVAGELLDVLAWFA